MQSKQDGLVPIGDALADLGGPVKAIREASPQALHHFTQADQVNLLVNASEAEPDLGFMARMLVLCSLPRANPGTQREYKRVNGPYTLAMTAGVNTKLPFGNLPRLLLAWICTEAVRTQSRELVLGRSLSDFMGKLGMAPVGGGPTGARTRLRNQMRRLFQCHVQLIREHERGAQFVSSAIADRGEFWWNEPRPAESVGKQNLSGRAVLQRDHPPPGAAQLEHPQGPQAFFAGPRFLPVARLPDVHPSCPAAALLAASLPPVWSGPG